MQTEGSPGLGPCHPVLWTPFLSPPSHSRCLQPKAMAWTRKCPEAQLESDQGPSCPGLVDALVCSQVKPLRIHPCSLERRSLKAANSYPRQADVGSAQKGTGPGTGSYFWLIVFPWAPVYRRFFVRGKKKAHMIPVPLTQGGLDLRGKADWRHRMHPAQGAPESP